MANNSCNYLIFNSTGRIENQMLGSFVALSPGFASLTGGYAHLATPWQRANSLIYQTNRHLINQKNTE